GADGEADARRVPREGRGAARPLHRGEPCWAEARFRRVSPCEARAQRARRQAGERGARCIRSLRPSPPATTTPRWRRSPTILFFEANVGDRELQGIDILEENGDGKVAKLTVMIRPLSGLQAVSETMRARLGVG